MAQFILQNGSGVDMTYSLPNLCPFCHHRSTFQTFQCFSSGTGKFFVVMRCPNDTCREVFVANYRQKSVPVPVGGAPPRTSNYLEFSHIDGGTFEYKRFSDAIIAVSPSFQEIHMQAESAEFYRLNQIAGVGYRKALEFLIKDYSKKLFPEKASHIEKIQLGPCIEEYIEHTKIKLMARRATWLGNDETHYVRKWVDTDINDLKALIALVVYFIDSEELYQSTLASMPEGKK